jgi:hypothetical protein
MPSRKTRLLSLAAGQPLELPFDNLEPDTEYFYRLHWRRPGEARFQTRPECRFHTQRATGSSFTFGIQGDSHPERPQMNDPALYARTLLSAAGGDWRHPLVAMLTAIVCGVLTGSRGYRAIAQWARSQNATLWQWLGFHRNASCVRKSSIAVAIICSSSRTTSPS